jgi:hypothetical protein
MMMRVFRVGSFWLWDGIRCVTYSKISKQNDYWSPWAICHWHKHLHLTTHSIYELCFIKPAVVAGQLRQNDGKTTSRKRRCSVCIYRKVMHVLKGTYRRLYTHLDCRKFWPNANFMSKEFLKTWATWTLQSWPVTW